MLAKEQPLSKLAEPLKVYPQVLKNVRVKDKTAAKNDADVQATLHAAEAALGDSGRILIRESGTEPVVRVMSEGPSMDTCREYVDSVVQEILRKGHADI